MNDIEILEEFIEQYNASYPEEKEWVAIYPNQIEALQGLLDLYNKEKEKNFKRSDMIFLLKAENTKLKDEVKTLENADLTTVYMDGYYDGMKAKIIKDKNAKTIEIKKINIIEQKDKIIDLMAEEMVNGVYLFKSKNQVIDYFTNKAEEDKQYGRKRNEKDNRKT